MDFHQGQHQPLIKPLYTRLEDLLVKAMNRIGTQDPTNDTFLMGTPPLVCPPPPSDTPPPLRPLSFNHSLKLNQSIELSGKLNHEIQGKIPNETTISERTKTPSSSDLFEKWVSFKTQQSNPPLETKLIKPYQNQLPRWNCTKRDPDESTIEGPVNKMKSIRYCHAATTLIDWKTAVFTPTYSYSLAPCDGTDEAITDRTFQTNRCPNLSTTTRFHTGSNQRSRRIEFWGLMVILSLVSEDIMVKIACVIMGATKTVLGQYYTVERGNDKTLIKRYPETGEPYLLSCFLLCVINKCISVVDVVLGKLDFLICFMFVLGKFNYFSYVVSVLVIRSVSMCATIRTTYYDILVLGEDVKHGQTVSHTAGLRPIRLRRQLYISLLPPKYQHPVHIPSSASVSCEPVLLGDFFQQVLSLPTRDNDRGAIGVGYLRRVLRLPNRDDKLVELLRSEKFGLLLWEVTEEEIKFLSFAFYHSRSRVFHRITNKQLTPESRSTRMCRTARRDYITNKLGKHLIVLPNMFLYKLSKVSMEEPTMAPNHIADTLHLQSSTLRFLGDKISETRFLFGISNM